MRLSFGKKRAATAAAVLCLVLVLTVQKAEVYGNSMSPLLEDGEWILVDKMSYVFRDPERYDLVVFWYEKGYEMGEPRYYTKRVIGLPGETVQITEGEIYINGEKLEEPQEHEDILEGRRAEEPVVLGEDEYFLLGDNRNNSTDSRDSNIGNVRRSELVGRVMFVP